MVQELNLEGHHTEAYRGFIRDMTINRNKLFSVKEVGFKPSFAIPLIS